MGRRIGKPQTPTKAGYSDVFDIRQHQKYVKDDILAKPEDDAIGSVKFDGTTYLDYTPETAGNRRTFTISFWFKRSKLSNAYQRIFSANDGTGAEISEITINNESAPNKDNIVIERYAGGTQSRYRTVGLFRDVNSWYHFVVAVDTTLAISDDRLKVYVNGSPFSFALGSGTALAQNDQWYVNSTNPHYIGRGGYHDIRYEGYLSNFTIVDGLQLDPSYLGYTDRETGQWKPKKYTGDFGTNGFHLPMENTDYAWNVDTAENYNILTVSGPTNVYDADYGGRVLNFDGTNDYLRMQDDAKTPLTNSSFTIAAWVNIKSGTGYGSIDTNDAMIKFLGTPNMYLMIQIKSDDTTKLQWRIIESDSSGDLELLYTYTTNEWFHFAYVADIDAGKLQLYINGSLHSEITTWDGTIYDYSTSNQYRYNLIGSNSHSPASNYLPMRIADMRFYDKSKSATQVSEIYHHKNNLNGHDDEKLTTGGDRDGLFMHFPCNSPFVGSGNLDTKVLDSPQNTFPTLNPLENGHPSATVVDKGNMRISSASDLGNLSIILATLGMPLNSGNWYFEVHQENGTDNNAGYCGITNTASYRFQSADDNSTNLNGNAVGTVSAGSDNTPNIYANIDTGQGSGTGSNYTISGTVSDTVWGFHFNADISEVTVYRNGAQFDTGRLTVDTGLFFPVFCSRKNENILIPNFGQDSTFAGTKSLPANDVLGPYTDANGIGEFYYPPPDGAKALCTKNLEGGLGTLTTTKKYYNRDETGHVLSWDEFSFNYSGSKNDRRFVDDNPFGLTKTDDPQIGSITSNLSGFGPRAFNATALGDGDYTVELWLKPTTASGANQRVFAYGTNVGSPYNQVALLFNSSEYLVVRLDNADPITYSTALALGKWYHVAIVRASGTVTLYVDGVSRGTTSNSTNVTEDDLHFGFDSSLSSTYAFKGHITNFRQVNGVAVYTGNFTVPTVPLETTQSSGTNIAAITGDATKFLLKPYKEETVNNTPPIYPRDETGKILVYETQKNPSGIFAKPFGPYADNSVKSFYFNGYNNIAIKDNLTAFQPGTGAFTFECWVFLDNVSSNDYHTIFDTRDSSGPGDSDSFFFGLRGTVSPAGTLYFYTGSTNYLFGSTQIVENNVWHHVALVRTSTGSGGLQLYLDGVGGTAETMANNFDNTNNAETYLGTLCDSQNYNLYGYLSDIRFVKGTAVYTGNFTPPSGKLTTTGGTYPSTTNVNTSITAGHTTFLAQPYSQPAQIHDFGSTYRTNPTYVTDETGKTLRYG